MTKVLSRLLIITMLVAGILVVGGCASVEPAYQKVDNIPDNVGLVYIYRPNSDTGGDISYDIKVGDTTITTLYAGGYYPYFCRPAKVEFWAKTESKSAVTLDIKAGQTYYIKGAVGIGSFAGQPYLAVVAPELAEKEIVECKLIRGKKERE